MPEDLAFDFGEMPGFGGGDWREFDRKQEEEFKRISDRSDALPEGSIRGVLLSFARGDGYAYYLVTEERPLTLAWLPYADAWDIPAAHIRGLTRDDVLEQHKQRNLLTSIFGKRQ